MGSACSHPATAGCEPNHDCHAPACAVIRSFGTTDVGACCEACEADAACGAYTLNHGTKTCWLRTTATPRRAGQCLSGTVPRAPVPPPPPLPPLPPQPPHPGITFASPPDVVAEQTNADSFHSLPCGSDSCVFGNGGTLLWSPSKRWHNGSTTTASFAMASLQPGVLQTIGNLTDSAVDGDAFEGDGTSTSVRFDSDGSLRVAPLEPAGGVEMSYTGLPCRAYKHRIGSGGTVRMDDGSLLQTVNFKCYNDSSASPAAGDATTRHPLSKGHSTLGLYKSLNGVAWSYFSTVVSWHQTIGPDGVPGAGKRTRVCVLPSVLSRASLSWRFVVFIQSLSW